MICEFEKQTIDIKDPDMNKLIELLISNTTKAAFLSKELNLWIKLDVYHVTRI